MIQRKIIVCSRELLTACGTWTNVRLSYCVPNPPQIGGYSQLPDCICRHKLSDRPHQRIYNLLLSCCRVKKHRAPRRGTSSRPPTNPRCCLNSDGSTVSNPEESSHYCPHVSNKIVWSVLTRFYIPFRCVMANSPFSHVILRLAVGLYKEEWCMVTVGVHFESLMSQCLAVKNIIEALLSVGFEVGLCILV